MTIIQTLAKQAGDSWKRYFDMDDERCERFKAGAHKSILIDGPEMKAAHNRAYACEDGILYQRATSWKCTPTPPQRKQSTLKKGPQHD